MKKAHLFYKTTISIVIAFLIIMAASSAGPDKRNFEISKNLEIFNALYEYVLCRYYQLRKNNIKRYQLNVKQSRPLYKLYTGI